MDEPNSLLFGYLNQLSSIVIAYRCASFYSLSMRPIDRPQKTNVSDLKVGMFVHLPGNWTQHSFVRNKFLIKDSAQISRINNSGISVVVVDPLKSRVLPEIRKRPTQVLKATPRKAPKIDLGPKLMPSGFNEFITDSTVTPQRKAGHLYQVCLYVMENILKNPTAGNIIQFKEGVSDIVDLLLADKETATHLFHITSRDHYTYTHSINVGVMSILLTKALFGETTPHDMKELSLAYFLHDIGKANIPDELLLSANIYDDSERAIMEKHTLDGYNILKDVGLLSIESKLVLSQHHERDDGSGYPNGLMSDDIHIYSRICAVADVFDAMTSRRLYKPSHSLYDALLLMKFDMGLRLNAEVFSAFIHLFKM